MSEKRQDHKLENNSKNKQLELFTRQDHGLDRWKDDTDGNPSATSKSVQSESSAPIRDTDKKDGYRSGGRKLTKLGWIPEDWNIDTIGNSLKIENNKRKPISEEERKLMQGEYPYYGPTKVQDYINEYQYEGEYALIAEDGDHFLKYRDFPMTQLATGKFNVNNHAHVIRGTNKCQTKWFYWFYNRRSVFSHLTRQGAGRYKLNKAALTQLSIAYPSIVEQNKIIVLLDKWDKAIHTLTQLMAQKELRKKGLMQQLLTGKKRLPGFGGEWKEFKMSECFTEINTKNDGRDHEPLTISARSGFVSQRKKFDKVIAGNSLSNYTQLQKGDFAYNKGNSKLYEMGCIYRLEKHNTATVPFVYISFRAKNKVDPIFYKHWFINHGLDRQLKAIITSGARGDGLLNVNKKDFFSLRNIKKISC